MHSAEHGGSGFARWTARWAERNEMRGSGSSGAEVDGADEAER